jgi:PKD repeat protein
MAQRLRCLVALFVGSVLMMPLVATTASAAGPDQSAIVAATPSARTPNVLEEPSPDGSTADDKNERVLDLAQVGNKIVAGGLFYRVQNAAVNGGNTLTRNFVFSFDQTTGAVDTGFAPVVNGQVNTVLAGPGDTVYIGGTFTTVNGQTRRNLAQLSITTGALTAFNTAGINGAVNDLVLSGGRLFVGGVFSSVSGVAHGGLATLNPGTGKLDEYMGVDVAVNHNYPNGSVRAAVGVSKLDISPDGARLVAIGNFKLADGLSRDQVVSVLLSAGGTQVDPNWATNRYQPACFSFAFDSYVRDVEYSPDGRYFVVATTGGHNPGTLCDTAARFETATTGTDVQPTWVADTGGDTLWSVAITSAAVYVGGHQRWMNNSNGSDYAGQGAVPRPGVAALDPINGVPLSWNPGRNPRGVGAQALLVTANGLYVGSDTGYIGNRQYARGKLALFPLAGGTPVADQTTGVLPANVYLAGRITAVTTPAAPVTADSVLYRINAGGPAVASTDAGPGWAADTDPNSPLRTSGSNAAGWGAVPATDASVPAGTPAELFSTERWDPADATELQWDLAVPAGQTVDVRLYFANRCSCTSAVGQRAFDVSIDGRVVLDDYDIVADAGDQTGTTKTVQVTSDGTVDIDFGHVVENPLVNAIEVVKATPAQPGDTTVGVDDVLRRWFDGTAAGTDTVLTGTGLDWSRVRGAFMAGGRLFYGYPDSSGAYSLWSATFDGTTLGAATRIDPYNDPYWSDISTGSNGSTYRGTKPAFYTQLSSVTGMAYADGQLYYTRANSSVVYHRGFSLDSGIVAPDEFRAVDTGAPGTAGILISGEDLYLVAVTGDLYRMRMVDGVVSGTPTLVSGPATDGKDWRARALFIGPGPAPEPPNVAPTASARTSCADLSCSFDAAASTDPDGTVVSYAWNFGDGATGTGAATAHAYTSAGTYPVTLTVTDDDGATAVWTGSVTVEEPVAGTGIAFRDGAQVSSRGTSSVSLTVPSSVQAGDGLVLVLSTNSAVTGTAPAGWTLAGGQAAGTTMTTQVFSRVATASDAGARVTVPLSGTVKVTLQLSAYQGTAPAGPVASVTGATDTGGTSHTTPRATAAQGSWVLSVWSDKSSAARSWTAPGSVSARSSLDGVGSGDVATLVADGGTPVPAGTVGGSTATVGAASNRSTQLTVVLAAAGGTPPPNVAPTASVQSSCTGLVCSFDGSGSTDPDGTVASWAWEFGDGTTGTGSAVSHTYAAASTYQVRLTVTDDAGSSGTTTSSVTVTKVAPAPGIAPRDAAAVSVRGATSVALKVPASVQAGDGLVLVLSTNSAATGTAPAGWTLAGGQAAGTTMTTQVFTRVAATSDAGSTVTVPLSASAKVTLQLLAYSGTAASGPVASVTGASDTGGTSHTTPQATATTGSWVLSVWSDKSTAARAWTAPSGVSPRSALDGVGSGDVATLVADGGAPVQAGTVGGSAATVPAASSRATMLTVVLRPAG